MMAEFDRRPPYVLHSLSVRLTIAAGLRWRPAYVEQASNQRED